MKGLIVIGYQGIGKSSLGGKDNCIDLESGNFWVGNERFKDWYIVYCQTAMDLANHGYTVFTSSHKEVYDFLSTCPLPENVGKVVIFCPPRVLKHEWIERLEERYNRTGLFKDWKALQNAKDRFDENIIELCSCGLPVIQPSAMDYDLHDYIVNARKKWCVDDNKKNIEIETVIRHLEKTREELRTTNSNTWVSVSKKVRYMNYIDDAIKLLKTNTVKED